MVRWCARQACGAREIWGEGRGEAEGRTREKESERVRATGTEGYARTRRKVSLAASAGPPCQAGPRGALPSATTVGITLEIWRAAELPQDCGLWGSTPQKPLEVSLCDGDGSIAATEGHDGARPHAPRAMAPAPAVAPLLRGWPEACQAECDRDSDPGRRHSVIGSDHDGCTHMRQGIVINPDAVLGSFRISESRGCLVGTGADTADIYSVTSDIFSPDARLVHGYDSHL